jgi:predicted glycosyltransferase
MKWRIPPVVLDKPVAFLPLLKAVDAVISAGGTMIREAAYLGIPAYSIFQGEIAAIDRYLESIGRLRIVDNPSEFEGISLSSRSSGPMLRSNPHLVDQVTEEIMRRLGKPATEGEEAA